MSRNFFPVALAVGMGIATSYYTFQPMLRDIQAEKKSGLQLGPGQHQSQSQSREQQQPKVASGPTPVDTSSSKGDAGAK
ncbi:hypothetical protein BJY01DRAFT_228227 [Aspergillus pseudoustus]|uniref:Uncharacterized protein n=1 Tax=Aspergillus pseudoustus TaxID=1810923 RepID=A0ABR4IM34_9EURO